jgi:hypothetical protein
VRWFLEASGNGSVPNMGTAELSVSHFSDAALGLQSHGLTERIPYASTQATSAA